MGATVADPTDKPSPKFQTALEVAFWERVYVATLESGQVGVNACTTADKALERRQARMSDRLRGKEEYEGEE